jgi:hypothetical protein
VRIASDLLGLFERAWLLFCVLVVLVSATFVWLGLKV